MNEHSSDSGGLGRRVRRVATDQQREASEWFVDLVTQAMSELPEPFLKRLDNLGLDVEWAPDPQTLRRMGVGPDAVLFGMYQGVPLPERSVDYPPLYPDRIVIYEQSIVEYFRTEDQIKDQVKKTVRHELGHYFGLSDGEMDY